MTEANKDKPVVDQALLGGKDESLAGFVKDAGLAEAFEGDPKTTAISEAREREVQLQNFIGQQSKLMDAMQTRLDALEKQNRDNPPLTAEEREQDFLQRGGVRKEAGQLYADGPAVLPPSEWNIPSLSPIVATGDDEDKGRVFTSGWTGDVPTKVRNPHRQTVRINDLKQDKDDDGYLISPFEVVDFTDNGYDKARVQKSRSLRFCLQRGMLVPASVEDRVGLPEHEPDSIQKRLSDAIGKVPRRGKIKRNAKTGKMEKEQGINDTALEAAATQHIQQQTTYDDALAEQREFESSGMNIV